MTFTPAQTRTFIFAAPRRGLKVAEILETIEYAGGITSSVAILALPKDTPPEVRFEILDALRRAYQAGREDRALDVPPETPAPEAWGGGPEAARALHPELPGHGDDHVHVRQTRHVHSHAGGSVEHAHPETGRSLPADTWEGGLEAARQLKSPLRMEGVRELLSDYDDHHAHRQPNGVRYVHAHDGGPVRHEHRSES